MTLAFQVPLQYCVSQHWILLLSPVTSTAGRCFFSDSLSPFFLELLLLSSPVAYWLSTDLGSSSFVLYLSAYSYFKWGPQGKNTGLPSPFPVDHILSELSTMTCPSWVALHGMAYSFTELAKAVVHVINLISLL